MANRSRSRSGSRPRSEALGFTPADGTGAQQPHTVDDEHTSLAFNRTQSAGGLGHGFGALRPLHAAAPPGRVQASDYAPAAGDAAAFPQTVTFSPVVRPRRGSAGSVASLEGGGGGEGTGDCSLADDDEERDHYDHEGTEWGGQSFFDDARSILSDAASMLAPNAYLRSRAFADLGSHHPEDGYGADAGTSGISGVSGAPWRNRMHHDDISERSSLLSRAHGGPTRAYGRRRGSRLGGTSFRGDSDAGGTSGLPRFESMPRWDSMDPGGTQITMREAMVSASELPGSNLGLVLIAVSQVCYSCMNLVVVLLDEREGKNAPGKGPGGEPAMGALQIVAAECFVIWVACTALMLYARTEHIILGPPGVRGVLFARGLCGWLSTLLLYVSLEMLPIAEMTSISFLAPLVTGVMAAILIGEPFTLREKIAGVSSLFGVTLIARPAFLFGRGEESDVPSAPGDTPPIDGIPELPLPDVGGLDEHSLGVITALVAVLFIAGAWVSLRAIGHRASTYHSIAYFSGVSWVASLLTMAALREPLVVPQSPLSIFLLSGIGLFSLCAQVFQTLGLQREKAGRAAVMSYLQILFATFFQVVLLGTPLEALSILGSVLILANGAWVASAKAADDDGIAVH